MNRNQINTSDTPSESDALQRSIRMLVAFGIAVMATVAIWLSLSLISIGDWQYEWGGLILLPLLTLLSFSIGRGLRELSLERRWRYRLAFATSAGLPLLLVVLTWVDAIDLEFTTFEWLFLMLVGFLGGLAGGLWITTVEMGLWENNSPPPVQIEAEVQQLHQAIINGGDPIPWAKRSFDLLLSGLGWVLSMPVWILSVFLIWIEDPAPILFVKNSVARGGANFKQYKLRTMVHGAEDQTGPVLAGQGDQRVLRVGRLLRKTALDELPQLINILRGDMSFVGPRPQRTVLVHGYLQRMPEYAERHRVLPGLAGLAQVAGDYYLTPRQKLRFDRLYIRYTGLGYDLLLITLAFMITFWYRWQPDWSGRLPRRYLHPKRSIY